MTRRKRHRDADVAAFGAEALPGGLVQIDEAGREHPATSSNTSRVPLLGLAVLMRLWRARLRERR